MTSKATQYLHNRIAIAFDFDDTLAPDTFAGLINAFDFDEDRFRKERYEPLKEKGWDAIPARFYSLLEGAKDQDNDKRLSRAFLKQYGEEIQLFDGVSSMFDRLTQCVRKVSSDIELEFYIVSSGLIDIVKHTPIADRFKAIWGCELHYDDDGEAVWMKRIVTNPDKVRYLYYLSKGVKSGSEEDLLFVYQDVPYGDLHVPLDRVIYVGDGTSDLPCFRLINQAKGIPIAVYPRGTAREWAKAYDVSESQRVAVLAEADYREGSVLMQSLELAVESVAKKIKIQQLGDRV